VLDAVGDLGCELVLEPGRWITANAGVLLARVLYEKDNDEKRFVVVDAAMNDLIRPALYQSKMRIEPVRAVAGEARTVDVVGPVCESGDFLAKDCSLAPVERGGLLAVCSAGAYGFSMSSNYNARPRAVEVLVDGDRFAVVRARETYEDLVRGESIPEEITG
jgi:diaminopimelate decarboxylase